MPPIGMALGKADFSNLFIDLSGQNPTSLAVAQEPKVKDLFGLPPHVAVAAVMPLGRPVKQLTRLTRKPVSEFAMRERWGGAPLG